MSPAATTAHNGLMLAMELLGHTNVAKKKFLGDVRLVSFSSMEEMPTLGRCQAEVLERLPPTP